MSPYDKPIRRVLFRLPPSAETAAKHVVYGLITRWTSADFQFGYEFDPTAGDFVVLLETNYVVPEAFVQRILNEGVGDGD